jgi:hypothetical protein
MPAKIFLGHLRLSEECRKDCIKTSIKIVRNPEAAQRAGLFLEQSAAHEQLADPDPL